MDEQDEVVENLRELIAGDCMKSVIGKDGVEDIERAIALLSRGDAWIAVEERLPPEHGVYECTLESRTGGPVVVDDYFSGAFSNKYITAWRPRHRPAPYQPKERGTA